MYHLLMADDRKEIVDSIAHAVAWNEYDIFPHTAYNGKEALEFILAGKADIVVSDIKMPFLSGLEIVQECKDRGLTVKFIMLSGYDDFSYAKQAISLGVAEYLLKPVKMDDLLRCVLTLKEKIRREETVNANMEKLHRHEIHSLPTLKTAFFEKLVAETALSPQEIANHIELLELQIKFDAVCIVLISIDRYREMVQQEENEVDMLRFAISNMATELFEDRFLNATFHYGKNCVAVVLNYDKNEKHVVVQYHVYALAQKVQDAVNAHFGQNVTLAISGCYQGSQAVHHAFLACSELLNSTLFEGENTILSQIDLQKSSVSSDYPKKLEEEIIKAVSLHDGERALQKTDELCEKLLLAKDIPPFDLKNKICNLIIKIGHMRGVESNVFELSNEFISFSTMQDMRKWLHWHICALTQEESPKRSMQEEMETVKQYIRQNFQSVIALKDLSKDLYMSQSYLSTMFKEHTGMNFNQFVTSVRMEKAQELLVQNKYKIYQVADMVGYQDTKYFSDSFRKATGMLPKKWVQEQLK